MHWLHDKPKHARWAEDWQVCTGTHSQHFNYCILSSTSSPLAFCRKHSKVN